MTGLVIAALQHRGHGKYMGSDPAFLEGWGQYVLGHRSPHVLRLLCSGETALSSEASS